MILLIAFVVFFAVGFLKARKAGGGTVDRLRYGFIYGLLAALVVYAVATLGDWQGFFG